MVDRDWSKVSPLEKAEYFASIGQDDLVISTLRNCTGVSDAERRRLISTALNNAANFREQKTSQGLYHQMEWENPNAAIVLSNYAPKKRLLATEILYPEDGEKAEEHWKRLTNRK